MNPTDNSFERYNRELNGFNLMRDYMRLCSGEQTTINHILHSQNLLSNNRHYIFNQFFRFIQPEQSNALNSTFPLFNNTFNPRNRWAPSQPRSTRRTPRVFQFPRRNNNTATTNPLQEFINESINEDERNILPRRMPTTVRQIFDSCSVFVYSNDLSNNQIHCPITMQNFQQGEICIRLPCNHIFKYRPLLQWLSTSRTCPMCRRQIPHTSRHTTRTNIRNNTHNASIQTTDISNGFVSDISANSIEELTSAITSTVSSGIRNLFQNMDPSGNVEHFAWGINTSVELPRDYRQSPINLPNLDISNNNMV